METKSPVYIHLGEAVENPPVGSSHWFGYPDLPPDMEIPQIEEGGESYALTLVCQINLSELPLQPAQKGLLLFFADIAYYGGHWDEPSIGSDISDNQVCRVVYVPAEKMGTLVSCREYFFEQDEPKAIGLTFNRDKPTLAEPELQLFGRTDHLEWEDWPSPCEGWQLLLMMDSMSGADYSYNFIDWGVLCFLIECEALERKDFSNVKTIILST